MRAARVRDLAVWVAEELGGRVTRWDLRTGPLLRRTHKIVANARGPSWECYVSAASVWLWINNLDVAEPAAFSVNRPSVLNRYTERLPDPFAWLPLPVYVAGEWVAPPERADAVRAMCRRLEPFFAALVLARGEHVTVTPAQITVWNRRPSRDRLRVRIRLMEQLFDLRKPLQKAADR